MSDDRVKYLVEFDEESAICKRPDGSEERVKWSDIIKVTIEATAGENKDAPDHVWILWGRDNKSGCVYPGDANGAELMLVQLQSRLDNFDIGAFAKAMKSEENNTWLLWQADGGVNTPEDEAPRVVN